MAVGVEVKTVPDRPERFDRAIRKALTTAGMLVEGSAISLVPIDTGRLKGSITYAVRGYTSRTRSPAKSKDAVSRPITAYVAHVGTNVEYAEYQEYGTRKMKAQPYLRPALDMNRTAIREIFETAMTEAINGRA